MCHYGTKNLPHFPGPLPLGSFSTASRHFPELFAQMRPATYEKPGDCAGSVDDDGLGNRVGCVLLGNGPVTVKRDCWVHLVPLKHGGDLLRCFLQVDGHQPDVPILKLAGDPLDLRHRLQARSTPGGPEIEDDHHALGLRQMKLRSTQKLEFEVGARLTDQGGFRTRRATRRGRARVRLERFRLRRVLQFPLLIDKIRRGLFDALADQQLTDFLESDLAGAQHIALASECLAGEPVGQEGQADAVVANRLNPGARSRGRRRRRIGSGGIELIRMQPDNQRKSIAGNLAVFQANFYLEFLVIQLDQPSAEKVAVPRANQVGGRVFLLHAGQGEQSVSLGLVQPDGSVGSEGQLDSLDLVVSDESARGERGAKGNALFIDPRDLGRNDVAASQIECLTLAGGLNRLIATQRERKPTTKPPGPCGG